jgi:alkaline phosphatase D
MRDAILDSSVNTLRLEKNIKVTESLQSTNTKIFYTTEPFIQITRPLPNEVEFDYGVASGDPFQTSVILWTHARYKFPQKANDSIELVYQVSTSRDFTNILTSGDVIATSSSDFTVKVDVSGLSPNTAYFYRFVNKADPKNVSTVGKTKTLPLSTDTSYKKAKFAVVSCSNYPQGYFHAYREIGNLNDIDCVIHLGDYIYEYGVNDSYGVPFSEDRYSSPTDVLTTLDDFRARYAQYRQDKDLQYMHAMHPMIAIWDDHEVSDDTYLDGTLRFPKHSGVANTPFTQLKQAAIQAYFEWMPIRGNQVYRGFDFGSVLSLHMLDTRHHQREKPMSYGDYGLTLANELEKIPESTDPVFTSFDADYNQSRKMMGNTQVTWLTQRMTNSNAMWQVIGNQVLMARIEMPRRVIAEIIRRPINNAALLTKIGEYVFATQSGSTDPSILAIKHQKQYGYNLDAWDGYRVERDTLFEHFDTINKPVIVLSGDSHNAWFNALYKTAGDLSNIVGYEFGVPSVSSIGLEAEMPSSDPSEISMLFQMVSPSVKYLQSSKRGFVAMEFDSTTKTAKGEYYFVDSVQAEQYVLAKEKSVTVSLDGNNHLSNVSGL